MQPFSGWCCSGRACALAVLAMIAGACGGGGSTPHDAGSHDAPVVDAPALDAAPGDGPVADAPPGDAPPPAFHVGVAVTGLAGSGLVLEDNGGDDLPIAADGTYTFATTVADGAGYAVTVSAQPTSPWQTCAVTGGTGTVAGADVSVAVACTTDTHTIGGTLTGLSGAGLVLANGADMLPVAAGATGFTFATPVASGAGYAVTVATQPSGELCSVAGGSGTVADADITSVAVTCARVYHLNIAASGVAGTSFALRNSGDTLAIPSDGTYTFPTPIASGGSYDVAVAMQPIGPWQTCTVASPSGTVANADVTLTATCTTNAYHVKASVSGLTGSGLVLRD